jgi:mannosyltransferase OCH1-like enzyme
MSIPKIIHQTFKTDKLPFITRWHISRFRKRNPEYAYEFYDDERIASFLQEHFDEEVFRQYQRLNIGAAKADFFRYAVMLKRGGVYIDVDSAINSRLDNFILGDDVAIISREHNQGMFVQWALIFEPGHPFMQKTLEMVLDNIRNNRYPHDVHKMTGPQVYSSAIKTCLAEDKEIQHRLLGYDYNDHLRFKFPLNKLMYTNREEHWKKKQIITTVLKSV